MGFWVFMFIMTLLIPAALLLTWYMCPKFKTIHNASGYRTKRSMKKHIAWSIIIAILTVIYVALIHVFAVRNDEHGHLSLQYLLLHFIGVIPCGIMAVRIILCVEEAVWEWFCEKYGNYVDSHPFLYPVIYCIHVVLFGVGGFRSAGVVPLLILIIMGMGPTMVGILTGNLILGNGWTFII